MVSSAVKTVRPFGIPIVEQAFLPVLKGVHSTFAIFLDAMKPPASMRTTYNPDGMPDASNRAEWLSTE
jgi:hypothetical protein